MGIIETNKELTKEEGFEVGLKKGRVEEKTEFTEPPFICCQVIIR